MNLSKAPEQGIMYALYTDRVEYRPYKKEELSKDDLQKHFWNCICLTTQQSTESYGQNMVK